MVYAAPVDGGGLLHVRIDVGVDTDADAAELDDAEASAEDQQRLIEAFVARHSAA